MAGGETESRRSKDISARKLKNPEQATFILESTLRGLRKKLDKLAPKVGLSSAWSDYTVCNNNYWSDQAGVKERFVHDTLKEFAPSRVLDIGCNTGQFSAIAANWVQVSWRSIMIRSLLERSGARAGRKTLTSFHL